MNDQDATTRIENLSNVTQTPASADTGDENVAEMQTSLNADTQAGQASRFYLRDDTEIQRDIIDHLARSGQVDVSRILAQVENGKVTLFGTVDDWRVPQLVEELVAQVGGVRMVDNQLTVERAPGE